MKENQKAIRLSAYVLAVSFLSLVLQAEVQVLGQFLILPVMFPLLMLGLVFRNMGEFASYLDIDSGPFASFLFRGLATGLFWGGCIAYPMDMFRRTRKKRYKIILVSLGVYAVLVFLLAGGLFLLLAKSGWTD